jgi:hypothetical protein
MRNILARAAVLLAVLASPPPGSAVMFDDPSLALEQTWTSAALNLPQNLGGLFFSADGDTLYVVGDANSSSSALWAVPVTRNPATDAIVALGPNFQVTKAFDGNASTPGLDAGWAFGPAGTLFYNYWDANWLGQRPGGVAGAETSIDLGAAGVPLSAAGLAFSPHRTDPGTGFGMLQVSTNDGGATALRDIYDVPLTPAGGGTFTAGVPQIFATVPDPGITGLRYVPSGPRGGQLLYANWDLGEIRALAIDVPTGLAIDDGSGQPTLGTSDPVETRLVFDLGQGPLGLAFDPLTNDLFVATWEGVPFNAIIQISGLATPTTSTTTVTSVTTTTSTTTTLPFTLLPGGGKAKSDCYVGFGLSGAPAVLSTKKVECTDGDPGCDLDGVCNNSCRFGVAICVNDDSNLGTCAPPAPPDALVEVLPKGNASSLALPSPLDVKACGAFSDVDVAVRLRKNGEVRKPGKTKLKVIAKSTAKPRKDKDSAILLCRPSAEPCPIAP